MWTSLSASFACVIVLNLLNLFCDAVRLIREQGYRDNTFLYHTGDGGHAYHYNLETATSIYFKCIQYEKLRCPGRAILRIGGAFRHSQPHNHPPDPDIIGERHFRANVLNNARNARYISYQDIIDQSRRDRRYSRRVRSRMTLRRLRTPMYRARMSTFPPLPQTLRELTQVLLGHGQISETVDGQENMYAGSVTAADGSHHVLFISPRIRRFMEQCKTLQGDGTFRARPATPYSSQCFVLVTTWRDSVIPLAWILMEKRTVLAYTAVFNLLKQVCPNLDPDTVISDWELPQQLAWQQAFPRARIQGCLWHLCRAFIKKANTLGIMRYRRAFPEILNFIRKACAISLLPEDLFDDALNILKQRARETDFVAAYLMQPFFEYVRTRWLQNPYRRNWMSFYRVMHRTNNSCETHNRMLRKAVGAYRPNVYAFLEAIARLEHNASLDLDLMRQGGAARRTRRWQSVFSDRQLDALSNDLEMDVFHDREETVWNFISRGSHLFHGAFDQHILGEVGQ